MSYARARGLTLILLLALSLLACSVAGCATGAEACKTDPNTGFESCQRTSGDYGEAAATGVVAATGWAVVGCTANGCEPPTHCNAETKQCERDRCGGEGQSTCPGGYSCASDGLCK